MLLEYVLNFGRVDFGRIVDMQKELISAWDWYLDKVKSFFGIND